MDSSDEENDIPCGQGNNTVIRTPSLPPIPWFLEPDAILQYNRELGISDDSMEAVGSHSVHDSDQMELEAVPTPDPLSLSSFHDLALDGSVREVSSSGSSLDLPGHEVEVFESLCSGRIASSSPLAGCAWGSEGAGEVSHISATPLSEQEWQVTHISATPQSEEEGSLVTHISATPVSEQERGSEVSHISTTPHTSQSQLPPTPVRTDLVTIESHPTFFEPLVRWGDCGGGRFCAGSDLSSLGARQVGRGREESESEEEGVGELEESEPEEEGVGEVEESEPEEEPVEEGPRPLVEQVGLRSVYNKKFRTKFQELRFEILPAPEGVDFDTWLFDVLTRILALSWAGAEEDDWVGMGFYITDAPERGGFHIAIRKKSQLTPDIVLDLISKMAQSDRAVFLEGRVNVEFQHSRNPKGSGYSRRKYMGMGYQELCHQRRCIVVIQDIGDNLCLPSALVVARNYVPTGYRNKKRYQKTPAHRKEVLELCERAGVVIGPGGAGLDELRAFQKVIPDKKITVYSDRYARDVFFEGDVEGEGHIDLFLNVEDRHYNVVTDPKAMAGTHYFCRPCRVGWSNEGGHFCPTRCKRCLGAEPCKEEPNVRIFCQKCNFTFTNRACFAAHNTEVRFTKKRTTCDVRRWCHLCDSLVFYRDRPTSSKHQCGERWCFTCKSFVVGDHLCFMTAKESLLMKAERKAKNRRRNKTKASQQSGADGEGDDEPPDDRKKNSVATVAFDLETRQDETLPNGRRLHIANLCVAQVSCQLCKDENDLTIPCEKCGDRELIFRGDSCVQLFMEHMFNDERMKKYSEVVTLGHNLSGFDGHFIMKYLCGVSGAGRAHPSKIDVPDVLMNGTRILQIKYGKFKFVDTLNFIPMKLSMLPKAFDLGEGIGKGYFPHYFNTKVNEGATECEWPSMEMYGVDRMSLDDRTEFEMWYHAERAKGEKFNFERELERYCRADVDILRRTVIKFTALCLESSKIDPFRECCTIANYCMFNYRANFLKEGRIGLTPPGGYFHADKQSKGAIEWLKWEAHRRGVEIRHADNGREEKVGRWKLDGYYETPQGEHVALEYLGCYYHGHRKCFPNSWVPAGPRVPETMGDREQRTRLRSEALRRHGFTVVEMWECEWNELKKSDPEIRTFVEQHPVIMKETLDPKKGFYGGRCGNTKKYFNAPEGTEIRYIDVTSLYPFINKYGKYPIGHPTRKVYPDCPDPREMEGMIDCTVLPPQGLYHPVLPRHLHSKLMNVLCRACGDLADHEGVEECTHSREERMFRGTWVVDEVVEALNQGYELIKTHETWEYRITQYDPCDPSTVETSGLFAEYVNANLKGKIEASGWPKSCDTEAKKAAFVAKMRSQGVEIEPGNMVFNAGLRQLCKINLNCLWGKLSQGNNLKQTLIVTDTKTHYELLTNPAVEVLSITPLNEEAELVQFRLRDEAAQPGRTTSVVAAAYTTAQARLELYKYLNKLGERVMYYDTDSVIYSLSPGEEAIECGSELGEMTDELAAYGAGSYAIEFVSAGPKVYGLKIAVGGDRENIAYILKVKGISLNSGNNDLLNFETLKQLVLGQRAPIRVESKGDIRREKWWRIVSKDTFRTLRALYTKRKRSGAHDTVPFGYKRQRVG